MDDQKKQPQQPLVTKDDNPNPEYQRLITEYTKNPLYDMVVKPGEKKLTEKKDSTPATS